MSTMWPTFGGKAVSDRVERTLKSIEATDPALAQLARGRITQGRGNAAASKGTHLTGDAIDLSVRGLSEPQIAETVSRLNGNGFVAVYRPPGVAGPSPHIHAALRGYSNSAQIARKATGVEAWRPIVTEYADQYDMPPDLILSVIKAESGGNPRAKSKAGAMGLMQLMPGTARAMGVSNPMDPRQNIRGGVRYLREMYDRFGDFGKAVAAYNAGPGAVKKYGGTPPYKETQNYVSRVMGGFTASDGTTAVHDAPMPPAPSAVSPQTQEESGPFDPVAFVDSIIKQASVPDPMAMVNDILSEVLGSG